MKHIANRGYTDVILNKHIDKDAVLEEEYQKENKELTEERIKYLVEERNLYSTVEEVNENNIKDITAVDEIPEGEEVINRVDIVEEETNEETEAEEVQAKDKVAEAEDVHSEDKEPEAEETKEAKETTRETEEKNNNKNTKKNNKKNEQN